MNSQGLINEDSNKSIRNSNQILTPNNQQIAIIDTHITSDVVDAESFQSFPAFPSLHIGDWDI